MDCKQNHYFEVRPQQTANKMYLYDEHETQFLLSFEPFEGIFLIFSHNTNTKFKVCLAGGIWRVRVAHGNRNSR